MEFFAIDDVVAQMEADLASAKGSARLTLLLELSWQLRQRDTKRALTLASEAKNLLADADLPTHQRQNMALRLLLIQGEAQWLFGDIGESLALAERALEGFSALNEAKGCADAHWLLAEIAHDQGDGARRDAAHEAMAVAAFEIDPVRFTVAQAACARFGAFRDVAAIKQRWGAHFTARSTLPLALEQHPAAACWIEFFLATIASLSSDYPQSIQHLSKTFTLALASGQQRRALIAAVNISDDFNNLNEYQAALEWMQRALSLARENGWPGIISLALTQTGETLRRLQRYDAAADMLHEALAIMTPLHASRNYCIALHVTGNIQLDRLQYTDALDTFRLLEQTSVTLAQADLLSIARCGQAQALLQLGQPQEALLAAQAALTNADAVRQIRPLRIMAQIHAHHTLPPPPNIAAPSAALHYLQKALNIAATITNYTIPADLLEAAADEHAKLGDTALAFQLAKQAIQVREKPRNQQPFNPAYAMQLAHQTEQARADAKRHRQVADTQAERAEMLQKNSDALEHLSAVGQEITMHLETQLICEVLNRHVHHLLDVYVFGISMLDQDGMGMHSIFGVIDGKPQPTIHFSLTDPNYFLTRCVRERREFLIDQDPAIEELRTHQFPTLSRLMSPLCIADKILGVISVQSLKRHAYGPREQMIFRTLSAYTAIALSNANAHGELAQAHRLQQKTQQKLVLQEKMAGLGTLTAGVAHEINNPANFAHVGAQNLRIDITEFEQFVTEIIATDEADGDDGTAEILRAFNQRFNRLSGNVSAILNGTERIKGIVRDLYTFTRLDEADRKTVHLAECLIATINLVRTTWQDKVEFIAELIDDPAIECQPALLNQVFMNLLVNGCQAIAEKQEQRQGDHLDHPDHPYSGKLWLRMHLNDEKNTLVIEFEDNGTGISADTQARIMEPFFTTKGVGKGTGLGLSMAYSIVQQHGGSLDIHSTPGVGSCFTIRLAVIS